MGQFVRMEILDRIATLTLNRPQRHNALVPGMLAELADQFKLLAAHTAVRVIALKARGESFSTGGDLRGFREHRENLGSYSDDLVGKLNDVMVLMFECDKPIVVAVDGQVCGGSLGLVLGGDIVLVTERASFTPYYVDVGFSPDGGWTALLPGLIGRKRACVIQMLNESISPQQALDWGLAYALLASTDLDARLDEVCASLLSKKAGSLNSTKRLIMTTDFRQKLDEERKAFVQQVVTDEALSGIDAFIHGQRGGT